MLRAPLSERFTLFENGCRVLERLHLILLDRLGEADQIDWERASLDSASIPAKRGPKNRC
jgi:hypothetical protein